MGDLAGNLGVSATLLDALHGAAEETGASIEALDGSLRSCELNLGQGKADDALKQTGLDPNELKNLDPTQAFIKISTALRNVANENQRAVFAAQIFGKSSADVFALINSDIEEVVRKQAELRGGLTDLDFQQVVPPIKP